MEGTGLYSGLKMLQVEDVNNVKSLSDQQSINPITN